MDLDIVNKVKYALIKASSSYTEDQLALFKDIVNKEKNVNSKWGLELLLENAHIAQQCHTPLCDDTGIPHLFLEVGRGRTISGNVIESIYEGIKCGLRELPGRPMAIIGSAKERLDQSGQIHKDSDSVLPAPLLVKYTDRDILRLYVLMLGGGPAIRGITYRIFHKHSIDVVLNEIIVRSAEGVRMLGCSPCTLAIGVGRSQFEATSMMIEAMVYGGFGVQTELEQRITDGVNNFKIGTLGLGGDYSVLATFLKVGPQRASGVRIVSIRPCCCVEPRRSFVDL